MLGSLLLSYAWRASLSVLSMCTAVPCRLPVTFRYRLRQDTSCQHRARVYQECEDARDIDQPVGELATSAMSQSVFLGHRALLLYMAGVASEDSCDPWQYGQHEGTCRSLERNTPLWRPFLPVLAYCGRLANSADVLPRIFASRTTRTPWKRVTDGRRDGGDE